MPTPGEQTTRNPLQPAWRRRLSAWLLFPLLLPVFYVLAACRFYYDAVSVGTALRHILLYLGIAVGLAWLGRLLFRRWTIAALFSWLSMMLMFYWPRLADGAKEWLGIQATLAKLPVLAAVVLSAVALALFGFAKARPATRGNVVFLLNAAMLIYVGVEVAGLAGLGFQSKSKPAFAVQAMPALPASPGRKKLPVYLLVFDEYASTPSLARYWGFDNLGLDSFLLARNFSVQSGSRSNYHFTYFSLASMLNLGYLDTYANKTVRLPDYFHAKDWADDPLIARLFAASGYRVRNYSLFDLAGQQSSAPDIFLSEDRLISHTALPRRFRTDYWPLLVRGAWKARLRQRQEEEQFAIHRYNLRTRDSLMGAIVDTGAQWVYAHFLLPHTPYYFDDSLRLQPFDTVVAMNYRRDLRGLHNNIRYTNRLIVAVVDSILARNRGQAIIAILGDHGNRTKVAGVPPEAKLENLSAIYFPDGDYGALYNRITNVNTMRVVVNKALGMQWPRLDDRIYLLSEKN